MSDQTPLSAGEMEFVRLRLTAEGIVGDDESRRFAGIVARALRAAESAAAKDAEIAAKRQRAERAEADARRYRVVRVLSLRGFGEIWHRALAGERFDDVVDALAASQPATTDAGQAGEAK